MRNYFLTWLIGRHRVLRLTRHIGVTLLHIEVGWLTCGLAAVKDWRAALASSEGVLGSILVGAIGLEATSRAELIGVCAVWASPARIVVLLITHFLLNDFDSTIKIIELRLKDWYSQTLIAYLS